MTYREILKLYRDGKLDEEQRSRVEADIEKQDAISEYLFEESEIPGMETLGESEGCSGDDSEVIMGTGKQDDPEFIDAIRRSIRRAFVKMGVIVGAVTLLITLFVIFALPRLVDRFYYDPSEIVSNKNMETQYDLDTNRLSLDFSVYSEMFLPGQYRWTANAEANGYGNYDIVIRQNSSTDGSFNHVTGKIVRNKMTLYDLAELDRPSGNTFYCDDSDVDNRMRESGICGTPEEAKEYLDILEDNRSYTAYISFDRAYSYEEFRQLVADQEIPAEWAALCRKTSEEDSSNRPYMADEIIGFALGGSAGIMAFDEVKYPYLTQFALTSSEQDILYWEDIPEDRMKTHVISMLSYMEDHPEVAEMMQTADSEMFREWRESIEENGLYIYGVSAVADKATLKRLYELDAVTYIYSTALKD